VLNIIHSLSVPASKATLTDSSVNRKIPSSLVLFAVATRLRHVRGSASDHSAEPSHGGNFRTPAKRATFLAVEALRVAILRGGSPETALSSSAWESSKIARSQVVMTGVDVESRPSLLSSSGRWDVVTTVKPACIGLSVAHLRDIVHLLVSHQRHCDAHSQTAETRRW
jgi:hypothetical protein